MEVNKREIKKYVVRQNFTGRIVSWLIVSIAGYMIFYSYFSKQLKSDRLKGIAFTKDYLKQELINYFGIWTIVVIIIFFIISFLPLILIDSGKFIIFEDRIQTLYQKGKNRGGDYNWEAAHYYVYFENLNRCFNKRISLDMMTFKKLNKGEKYYIVYIPLMFKFVIIRHGFYLADSVKKYEANQAELFKYFGRG